MSSLGRRSRPSRRSFCCGRSNCKKRRTAIGCWRRIEQISTSGSPCLSNAGVIASSYVIQAITIGSEFGWSKPSLRTRSPSALAATSERALNGDPSSPAGAAHVLTTESRPSRPHLGAACARHRMAVCARRRDGMASPRGRLCRRSARRRRPAARGAGRGLAHGSRSSAMFPISGGRASSTMWSTPTPYDYAFMEIEHLKA